MIRVKSGDEDTYCSRNYTTKAIFEALTGAYTACPSVATELNTLRIWVWLDHEDIIKASQKMLPSSCSRAHSF